MTEKLTRDSFRTKVFDYGEGKQWKYEGELPAIIDFWAEWCGPCKQIAPVLEELSEEYAGKLNIYKINTDEEQEIAGMFNIQSIPSLLFIPVGKQPQMSVGALPKKALQKAIKDVLAVE